MRILRLTAFLFLLLAAYHLPLSFAAFEPRGVGARALALGGAYTAAQNDVSSIYWNPASLSTMESREFEFMYEDLYSKGLVNFTNVAFAYPAIGPGTMGVSWTRFGATKKTGLNYSENTYSFAYGMKVIDKLSLGATLNYFRLNSDLNASGFGIHLGLLYRPFTMLSLGAFYQNIGRTTVRYESGAIDPLPSDIRLGAVLTRTRTKILFDADKLLTDKPLTHFGIEVTLNEHFDFRGGISRRVAGGFDWVYTLGFGTKVKSLGLDYAFENHFDLGPSHIVSVKLRF